MQIMDPQSCVKISGLDYEEPWWVEAGLVALHIFGQALLFGSIAVLVTL